MSDMNEHHATIEISGWGRMSFDPADPRAVETARAMIGDHFDRLRATAPGRLARHAARAKAYAETAAALVEKAAAAPEQPAEPLGEQVDRLAAAVLASGYVPEQGEGAVDTAIRLLKKLPPGPAAEANAEAAERAHVALAKAATPRSGCVTRSTLEVVRMMGESAERVRDAEQAAERRFSSWSMSAEQQREADDVRRGARELAETIACNVPQGPERDRAIDALKQASMLAVAGIARPPVGPTKSEA